MKQKRISLMNYESITKAYYSDMTQHIKGRESQLQQLFNFLLTHLKSNTGGFIYLAGIPGTGKTKTVNYTFAFIQTNMDRIVQSKKHHTVKFIEMNGLSFTTEKHAYEWLAKNVFDVRLSSTAKSTVARTRDALERALRTGKRKQMVVLFCDEADKLGGGRHKHRALLTLYRWAQLPTSRLLVVGAGNELLMTRVWSQVYRIKLHCVLFPAYSTAELNGLADWFLPRLTSTLEPREVARLSRSVGNTVGDARVFFSELSHLAEAKQSKTACSNAKVNRLKRKATHEDQIKVTERILLAVLVNLCKREELLTEEPTATSIEAAFPMISKQDAVDLKRAYESFQQELAACGQQQEVTHAEFMSLVESLEFNGWLRIQSNQQLYLDFIQPQKEVVAFLLQDEVTKHIISTKT